MRIRRIFILLSFIGTIVNSFGQTSPIWGNLKKGRYDVGFKVMYEFDYSRIYHGPNPVTGKPFPGEGARPVRIFVWYPALQSKSAKMRYRHYINVKPADKRFEEFNTAISDYDYWGTLHWTNGADSSVSKILDIQTEGIKNAKPVAGKFPLIVHFLGLNDRRNENIPLWEYLASHGYVVMTIPQYASVGDVSMELWGFSVLGRETQVRDMEFAMSKLNGSANIDFSTIGTIGYSYGSVFAMRMAMLNFNVKAVATFDGNVNNKNGQNILESFYNPKIKIDWLNIYRAKYEALDLKVFETLKYTNRYRVAYTNSNHGDFEDFAIATSLMPEQTPAYALKERDVATGKKNYETTCELTISFFDRVLKNKISALAVFDQIIDERRKEGIVSEYEYKKAAKVIDEEDLAHIIIYYGIPAAEEIYTLVKNDKDYEVLITQPDLLTMAKALRMGGRRLNKSNDVLFFMERNFPADNTVFAEIARNFIELKKFTEARNYLQKIILADKENKDALELMKLLK